MSYIDWDRIRVAPRKLANLEARRVLTDCGRYVRQHQGGPTQGAPSLELMLAFIASHTGKLPTIEEIRIKMGWRQRSSVLRCLARCKERLRAMGIERAPELIACSDGQTRWTVELRRVRP